MDVEFDSDGKPKLTLVISPAMAERISDLPPPTAEQEQAFQQLMERKRKEADARKRHR
jgi:hypothetical protein